MKIIKHGRNCIPNEPTQEFVCSKCGCVFTMDPGEYRVIRELRYIDMKDGYMRLEEGNITSIEAKCPECGHHIDKDFKNFKVPYTAPVDEEVSSQWKL